MVIPACAALLIRGLRLLIRWTTAGEESVVQLHEQGQPYIHAFYHDQLLMMTYSYLGRRWGRGLAVLSSRHRDGEYVARTLERFGHVMVRGSTDRGAVSGLRKMIRHLQAGRDAAFAVDGPRGPRHRVQPGVVEAGRVTGAPIVPVAFAVSRKKVLRSWDVFQIPLPFSRGIFVYGRPMIVPLHARRQELEVFRCALQERLNELLEQAERLIGGKMRGRHSVSRGAGTSADHPGSRPEESR